jgi:hypothetical protein
MNESLIDQTLSELRKEHENITRVIQSLEAIEQPRKAGRPVTSWTAEQRQAAAEKMRNRWKSGELKARRR